MRRRRGSEPGRNGSGHFKVRPRLFVFCDKQSGAARFKVEADSRGKMPIDQAAGLLAMHCLVRGQTPADYVVMVAAREDLFEGLCSRAGQLLAAGRLITAPVELSRREREVLSGVLEDLENKEIAARLSLSVRTIKFHVSGLLAKFHVRSRGALMREAAARLLPDAATNAPASDASAPLVREARCSNLDARGTANSARRQNHLVALPGTRLTA